MLERTIDVSRLVAERLRARWLKFRGARVSAKVNVGARVRVDHPRGVHLGTRVTIEPEVWIKLVNSGATLSVGDYTFIGRGSEFDVAQSVTIGDHTLIAPRVFVTDHSHGIVAGQLIGEQGCTNDPVTIGKGVWIGTGVTILCGVKIGDGAVIGAGSVVRQSVPANEVWAGVPAKKIRDR